MRILLIFTANLPVDNSREKVFFIVFMMGKLRDGKIQGVMIKEKGRK
jgi:hypothetical protein